MTNVDINSGSIDSVSIGSTTPAAGTFSTVDIDAGSIDGTAIGSIVRSTGSFSNVVIDTTTGSEALHVQGGARVGSSPATFGDLAFVLTAGETGQF
jgi:hypothetical protein